jgi:hypothetical protein
VLRRPHVRRCQPTAQCRPTARRRRSSCPWTRSRGHPCFYKPTCIYTRHQGNGCGVVLGRNIGRQAHPRIADPTACRSTSTRSPPGRRTRHFPRHAAGEHGGLARPTV